MKSIANILGLHLLLFSSCMQAQEGGKTNTKSFHYTYDNDLFAGSDRYYTQGSIVEFRHPVFAKSPIAKLMKKVFHGQSDMHCLVFRQDVFTPKSIRNKTLDSSDRPYAGTFLFSQKEISYWYASRLSTSLDVGCVGPAALGEQMQKFIHKHTNNAEPIGWENQVANSFVANFNIWYEHALLFSEYFDLLAEAGGKGGLLYTNASAGLGIRVGKKMNEFGDQRLLQQPKWELYATSNGYVTYVAHNAVLQGLPWNKSTHVLSAGMLERFVYRLDAGITFSVRSVSFTYTQSFLTPEFKGGLHHSWGGLNFVYRF